MKISTEIGTIADKIGMENMGKAVEMCAKAGFDAWDFSLFDLCWVEWKTGRIGEGTSPLNGPHYLEFARELKK